ncbi:hypothetical protein MKW92_053121 [Papaver armeniacum]|nr:hypothetical protein MKW92_053121 [Papaver armeniacum]
MYSKKRNKFLQQKLSKAVYIQYNRKLQRRYEEETRYGNGNVDRPIFLEAFDEDDDWLIPEGGGLVREGDDLTWEQANAASGAMEVGPSTRARRKERSDMHPSFSLLSETLNDDTLPPSDVDIDESDDSNFQFEMDYDKRMEANRSNGANGDKAGNEEEDNRVEL